MHAVCTQCVRGAYAVCTQCVLRFGRAAYAMRMPCASRLDYGRNAIGGARSGRACRAKGAGVGDYGGGWLQHSRQRLDALPHPLGASSRPELPGAAKRREEEVQGPSSGSPKPRVCAPATSSQWGGVCPCCFADDVLCGQLVVVDTDHHLAGQRQWHRPTLVRHQSATAAALWHPHSVAASLGARGHLERAAELLRASEAVGEWVGCCGPGRFDHAAPR